MAAVASVESTSQEPAHDQEKPKRRTTRRKKAVEAEVAIEEAPSEVHASSEPQQTAEIPSENTEVSQNGEKKKKGWWNRGGGFF